MPSPSVPHARRHLFDVGEFFRMAEAGVFGEEQRVELIDGEVVEMPEISGPHLACVNRLNRLLGAFSGESEAGYVMSVQNPVVLGDDGSPLPDLALLRAREDFYADPPPTSGDALLLIEVAASSLRYDRETKVPRYARAGVPEVWVVVLGAEVVELYADPRAGAYATKRTFAHGETVNSETVPGLSVGADEILGISGPDPTP